MVKFVFEIGQRDEDMSVMMVINPNLVRVVAIARQARSQAVALLARVTSAFI